VPVYKKVNKDFFKTWSPEMAYVLGFFAADGYITINKRGGHFFSFQIKERDILVKFRKLLGSEHKIAERNQKLGRTYRLQIGSKEICEDLAKLGLGEQKTFRLVIPKMPNICLPHFIRGYFDGDGNVWTGLVHKERKTMTQVISSGFTSGCGSFLSGLRLALNSLGLGDGTMYKGANYYRLTYSINDSLRLYNVMYSCYPNGDLFLSRKRKVFEKFIKMQR